MESSLKSIDWAAPWWRPWRQPGEAVAARVLRGLPLHDALNAAATELPSMPLRVQFASQDVLPAGAAYEQFIFERGICPTRAGLHDFFNGLVWLGMPQAKQRLNALQAEQIAVRGVAGTRGAVRDAITVFDENGALLDAPAALWEALLAREWKRAFIELRPLWQDAHLLVVGHALLEKLAAPRKDLTAHVWRAPAPPLRGPRDAADHWLAAQLTAEALAGKPFTPLPVLGIPGWCAANEDMAYYDDARVFRGPRDRR